MTSQQGKIWYRAYSLSDRAMIEAEHPSKWSTYMSWDTDCAFFTGPDNFMEGYYLDDQGEPCFVTKARVGSVIDNWMDYTFIKYRDFKLSIAMGSECDKELLAIKQVWALINIDSMEDDIVGLLKEYSALP